MLYGDSRFSFLSFGGYAEIGRNCFAIHDPVTSETLLIDAGLIIPKEREETVLDRVEWESKYLPPFELIRELAQKGKMRIVATHGHLDHVGAYPYLWERVHPNGPIICTQMTADIITRQFQTYQIAPPEFLILEGEDPPLLRHRIVLGPFDCEFFAVPHSIPQTRSVTVRINGAKLLFMSDFKLKDCFVYPGLTQKLEQYLGGEAPFDFLTYEALYFDREGFSPSEDTIREPLRSVFAQTPLHLIGTWFASNLIRYLLVEQECEEAGFVLGAVGRTMREFVHIGLQRGMIPEPKREPEVEPGRRYMIASTGHQGEGMSSNDPTEMSALVKAVNGISQELFLMPNDSTAFLDNPIPGNENDIKALILALLDRCPDGKVFITPETHRILELEANARLVLVPGLHASGHGFKGDHDRLKELTKPKITIPYPHTRV